jgi:phosphatidylglycerophosphatase A
MWQDGAVPRAARPLPSLGITLIATALGAGLSPVAPGTAGTLVAIPLAWGLARLGGQVAFVAGLALVTAVGTWAAGRFCRAAGTHDDQRIVIDEVAGYFVTLLAVPRGPVELALAFGLFRLFDIWKPPPVRQVDRVVKGGFGVMADDLAAGVYAGACLFALERLGAVGKIAALVGVGSGP